MNSHISELDTKVKVTILNQVMVDKGQGTSFHTVLLIYLTVYENSQWIIRYLTQTSKKEAQVKAIDLGDTNRAGI